MRVLILTFLFTVLSCSGEMLPPPQFCPPPQEDPITRYVSWGHNELVRRVYAPKCFLCHHSNRLEGGLDVGLEGPMVKRIVPGDYRKSKLWKLVNSELMPPQDVKDPNDLLPVLTEQELEWVKCWIINYGNEIKEKECFE